VSLTPFGRCTKHPRTSKKGSKGRPQAIELLTHPISFGYSSRSRSLHRPPPTRPATRSTYHKRSGSVSDVLPIGLSRDTREPNKSDHRLRLPRGTDSVRNPKDTLCAVVCPRRGAALLTLDRRTFRSPRGRRLSFPETRGVLAPQPLPPPRRAPVCTRFTVVQTRFRLHLAYSVVSTPISI